MTICLAALSQGQTVASASCSITLCWTAATPAHLVGWAQVAFDFDAAGNFLGMTLLEPPVEGTTAPPTPTAMPVAAPPTVPATVASPAVTQRQIAYHDAAGAIWLVDDSGANPNRSPPASAAASVGRPMAGSCLDLRAPPGAMTPHRGRSWSTI